MNRLLLGTRNAGKVEELRALFAELPTLHLRTQLEIPFGEVEESGSTFLHNALLKANGVCEETGIPVYAEDAGLEVDALDGAPGIYSARYAGEPVDYSANNRLLLERLRGVQTRSARFVAVAVLSLPDGQVFATTGILRGTIAEAPSGDGGFGYDPLFVPEGAKRTLAQMTMDEKNRISHRTKAVQRMMPILRILIGQGELESSSS